MNKILSDGNIAKVGMLVVVMDESIHSITTITRIHIGSQTNIICCAEHNGHIMFTKIPSSIQYIGNVRKANDIERKQYYQGIKFRNMASVVLTYYNGSIKMSAISRLRLMTKLDMVDCKHLLETVKQEEYDWR